MKNYITSETLPELLHDLAEKFMEHNDKLTIFVDLVGQFPSNSMIKIRVTENVNNEEVVNKEYEIINKVYDSIDVLDHTIEDALTGF